MESSVISELDCQILSLQQTLAITKSLRENCKKLENEKNEALQKCEELKTKLERLNNRKCTDCSLLKDELRKERKLKDKLKKEEKAKLLKTIAKTLESLDDGNTNPMTNAHQLLTELVGAKLDTSPEQKNGSDIRLIERTDNSENEDEARILANETIVVNGSEESRFSKEIQIIIPETEVIDGSPLKIVTKNNYTDFQLPKFKKKNGHLFEENEVLPKEEDQIEQTSKKLKLSPVLSSVKVSPPRDKKPVNQSPRSPSVLSEIIETAGGLSNFKSGEANNLQDEQVTSWKMKPSLVVESNHSYVGGKKLKQMALSLTRTERKHDISLSEGFKGGVAKHSGEDNDVILPSPEQAVKKSFSKKITPYGTLEDPDMTVFNPAITSTCLPVPAETSFDRIPEVQKSPPYKYRRETVRKRAERQKLPGQDCDQCARYYEAAGLDQTQEVRNRLNTCSRHRDKYQIRANTPPGFWDPVLPVTPEGSQDM